MHLEKILNQVDPEVINVTLDNRYSFPDYELEITWKEWRWNDARTARLDETISQGVGVNPVDFVGKDGDLDFDRLEKTAVQTLQKIIDSEDRVGQIDVLA